MARCAPSAGGCWFCKTDDEKNGWAFSWEWDAFFHPKCLKKAWLKGNDEAKIIVENELDNEDMKIFKAL